VGTSLATHILCFGLGLLIEDAKVDACIVEHHQNDCKYSKYYLQDGEDFLRFHSFALNWRLLLNFVNQHWNSFPALIISLFLTFVYESELLTVDCIEFIISQHCIFISCQVKVNTTQEQLRALRLQSLPLFLTQLLHQIVSVRLCDNLLSKSLSYALVVVIPVHEHLRLESALWEFFAFENVTIVTQTHIVVLS